MHERTRATRRADRRNEKKRTVLIHGGRYRCGLSFRRRHPEILEEDLARKIYFSGKAFIQEEINLAIEDMEYDKLYSFYEDNDCYYDDEQYGYEYEPMFPYEFIDNDEYLEALANQSGSALVFEVDYADEWVKERWMDEGNDPCDFGVGYSPRAAYQHRVHARTSTSSLLEILRHRGVENIQDI